ncbi:hypothetical protein L484_024789 [Morus notabilis]|uniref:Uncharacterized protein n=1 Tax=Morus notabilis TaxID=981085 RepID=W9R6Y6_9ROSA|nr:hypothetical protein L484_024789 [Morus notabilis]
MDERDPMIAATKRLGTGFRRFSTGKMLEFVLEKDLQCSDHRLSVDVLQEMAGWGLTRRIDSLFVATY